MPTLIPRVQTSADARKELSSVLRRFREEGMRSQPLIFGAHRKPEAVVIPYELYERIAAIIEDYEITEIIRERTEEGKPEPMDELFNVFNVQMPR